MKKIILVIAAAFAAAASIGAQYVIPRSTIDVRLVELEGHQYVVGSVVGDFHVSERGDYPAGGSGSAISVCHFEGCKCRATQTASYEAARAKSSQGARIFSKKMRLQKYEEQKGICPHCTNRFEFAEMEGDHIVPYSKGGKTEYSNLQMLCRPCNRHKGNRYSY